MIAHRDLCGAKTTASKGEKLSGKGAEEDTNWIALRRRL